MDTLIVQRASVDTPGVQALLQRHFAIMRATSPEDSCHVMEPDALVDSGAVIFAAFEGETVLGVGALAHVGADHGELKSMHTAAEGRGRGIGHAVLGALLDAARAQGMRRVSLETGADEAFVIARALYAAHGFAVCPPFGSYVKDPLSVFMTRAL